MVFWGWLAVIGSALASGGAAHDHPVHDAISADVQAGLIDEADALFVRYLQRFEPESVPVRYARKAAHAHADGMSCATPLVHELKQHWGEFSDDERARITQRLEPWKSDLFTPRRGDGVLPSPQGDVCWGEDEDLPNRIRTDHFLLSYHDDVNPEDAQLMADSLEFALQIQVEDWGWRHPEGMDDFRIGIYMTGQSMGGAYTTVERCDGRAIPYIVAGKDAFFNRTWGMDMAGHELHHAIQYAYGEATEFWFWESTATWIEEYIFVDSNGWSPYLNGYTDAPHLSMHASNQQDQEIFNHMYGMAMWNFWLDERFGGHDMIRDMWEYAATQDGFYSASQAELLAGVGIDFAEAYKGFVVNNTVNDFREGEDFPVVTIHDRIFELPAEGQSTQATLPQSMGQNYLVFRDPPAEPSNLDIEFAGELGGNWYVALVGTKDGQIGEVAEMEIAAGKGKVSLENYGRFARVWMVITPMRKVGTAPDGKGFTYAWRANTTPYDDSEQIDLPLEPEDPTGEDPAGCGCTTAAPSATWLLLALPLLARRRR